MYHLCMKSAAVGLAFVAMLSCSDARAQPLTINDLQSNTSDGDASTYIGQVADCVGGIVVSKFRGYRPRLILQDPDYPDGWGGIQVKDWIYNSGDQTWELFDHVEIGDWISLTNVLVEEFVGNTFLQYQSAYSPGFTVVSQGNAAPAPVPLSVSDLRYPLNHEATERYEAMAVILEDVVVGHKDLGKASDNYELTQSVYIAWGTDYMNADAGAPYDPRIETGFKLSSIAGIVEQYTSGEWDYYQLCTRSSSDILPFPVPTVSEWGLAVMGLLLLVGGTVTLQRWGSNMQAQA